MNSPEENMDKQIREKLEGHTIEPSANAWENVSRSIPANRGGSKRLLWLGILFGTLAIGAFIWTLSGPANESPNGNEQTTGVDVEPVVEPVISDDNIENEQVNIELPEQSAVVRPAPKSSNDAKAANSVKGTSSQAGSAVLDIPQKRVVYRKADTTRTETIRVTVTKTTVTKQDTVIVNKKVEVEEF